MDLVTNRCITNPETAARSPLASSEFPADFPEEPGDIEDYVIAKLQAEINTFLEDLGFPDLPFNLSFPTA